MNFWTTTMPMNPSLAEARRLPLLGSVSRGENLADLALLAGMGPLASSALLALGKHRRHGRWRHWRAGRRGLLATRNDGRVLHYGEGGTELFDVKGSLSVDEILRLSGCGQTCAMASCCCSCDPKPISTVQPGKP